MYETRYRHFKKVYQELLQTPHVRVTVVEMAFGERPFVIAETGNPRHLQVRCRDELWHKENLINLGLKILPEDMKYVCWMDADISFVKRETWAKETIEALQHYVIVQPWSHAIDLGPNGESINEPSKGSVYTSFCYCLNTGKDMYPTSNYYGDKVFYPHSGYVWAARREFFEKVGKLLEVAILGAGDHHMAWSLLGLAEKTFPGGKKAPLPEYRKEVYSWQDRAVKYVKQNIGYVPGTIYHYFHGKKSDRKYSNRWQVLVDFEFNPVTDLYKDWQGLWRLRVDCPRQIKLRNGIRDYMGGRNEDSVDV